MDMPLAAITSIVTPSTNMHMGKNLQYALHILCCSPGEIDGSFGASTEAAVKKYQQESGLTITGHINGGTWGKMTSLITEIQSALKTKGYYHGPVDGIPNPTTYRALVDFQNASGLEADGIMGPSTSELLLGTAGTGQSWV